MIDKDCIETEDERQNLFDLVDKLPLCKKTIYDTAKAKVDSGSAYSWKDAERQIAKETGKEVTTIRTARIREQRGRGVSLTPLCETELQSTCSLPHVAQNTGDNEWYTPIEYIDAVYEVMGTIDLDPASSNIANQTVKAKTYYTSDDNGLEKKWYGKVWLNPPYAGDLIGSFCTKLVNHFELQDIQEAIVLVNNATETGWFNLLIKYASAVVFPKSRIKFLKPEGNPGAPLQGQAVIYFGKNIEKFIKSFVKFGWGAIIYNEQ